MPAEHGECGNFTILRNRGHPGLRVLAILKSTSAYQPKLADCQTKGLFLIKRPLAKESATVRATVDLLVPVGPTSQNRGSAESSVAHRVIVSWTRIRVPF